MKFSKLFGKFLVALVVPSLMISSCALLGLEEEEEETTSTASSTLSTPSSSGSLTIGSYSYSSSLRTTNCRSVTDGTVTIYLNTILSFDTSALTAKHTDNIYSNSTCTTSAGSTVTFGGSSFSNPIIEDYTDIQVNKMSFGTGAQMQGADGNMVANDSNLYGVVGKFNSTTDSTSSKSNGDLRVIVWVIPGSNTTAQMSSGSSCADSTQSVPVALSSCTHYWNTTGQIYSAQTN
tara:strand:- start:123 stop:824 length:702 start_codon:yes stop_codon:yes gene_type:complete